MSKTFANAIIVLPQRTLFGSVRIEDGRIAAIEEGPSAEAGTDFGGDLLIPGLIDLHSDHIEKHYVPRGGITWDAFSAAIAHDAQVVSAGITTIFDSLSLTRTKNGVDRTQALKPMIDGLTQASSAGALRASHVLHLRCEVTEADTVERLEAFGAHPLLRLVSVMDHAPGERQFRDIGTWLERHRVATGLSDAALCELKDRQIDARATFAETNREKIAGFAAAKQIPLASHDDATAKHVESGAQLGAAISEFPTTLEAAQAASGRGLSVLMGAPNLVRGGSHVQNLSTSECAQAGFLDILASDYVPGSLLHAAFLLTQAPLRWDLPRAIATVTLAPARAAGFTDRGAIGIGQHADLVQVRLAENGFPLVQRVWRQGKRVH